MSNSHIVGTTSLGNTNIFGDINIANENTNIESNQLRIKDNIITLNSEETSDKVTANQAGIEISRGTSPSYKIVYDEDVASLVIGLDDNLQKVLTTNSENEELNVSTLSVKTNTITLNSNESADSQCNIIYDNTEQNLKININNNQKTIATTDNVILKEDVGNIPNKIPTFNSEGHLVLPSGIEMW